MAADPSGPAFAAAEAARRERIHLLPPLASWYVPAALAAFVLIVRLPGLPPSLVDWDEGLYMLNARALLHGQLPYVAVFDIKPLGTPALMAGAMTVLGTSVATVWLMGCASVTATALLLRRLTESLELPRPCGIAAAFLYAGFSTRLGGLATNTELLMAPFTVAGLCVAAAGLDTVRRRGQVGAVVATGLLFGLAMWIKYVAAVPAAAAFAILVGWWVRRRTIGAVTVFGLAALYAAACGLPTGLTALAYFAAGEFSTFWYCNFGYMAAYVATRPPAAVMRLVAGQSLLALAPLVFLGLWGCCVGWFKRRSPRLRRAAVFVAFWLAAEALAVAAPWKFYDHYFLVLLPPLALLAGAALSAIGSRAFAPSRRAAAVAGLAVILGLAPVGPGNPASQWPDLFRPDTLRAVAAVIRADPAPTAWVVNSPPVVYFLAGIAAPTRFPFPPHLVGDFTDLIRTDPLAEISRILAGRPRFIVLHEGGYQLNPRAAALVNTSLARDYAKVASVPTTRGRVDVFRLDAARRP